MGKAYAQELRKIPDTYDWANKIPINNLIEFVKRSEKTPLYVIGSGGSFSATTFVSLLHQHIGKIARCLTPLEFLEFENIDSNCSILIVTASGNNTDILSAFDKAVKIKPTNIGIVCASANNKIIKKASKITEILVHAVNLPTGKDGFLATNSLIATLIWLCRAYISAHSLLYKLPNIHELVFQGKTQSEFEEDLYEKLNDFYGRDTIVCLYDNCGKTAAVDSESKLVEAGLMNVQLADYRNFAHGRHNWLDKNQEKTGLIALANPNCEQLTRKTLKLIPNYTPKIEISTDYEGPIGAISLLIQILYVVKFFGNVRKIDPGKPRVADFGRKIYHLSVPKTNSDSLTNLEKFALRKKFGHCNTNEPKTKTRIKHLQKFLKDISKVKFGAIVFDYDGTLCDPENRFKQPSRDTCFHLTRLLHAGILVGIATGRGKSVRKELQKTIPKKYWQKLLVGYYNGGSLGYLDDDSKPDSKTSTNSDLKSFFEILRNNNMFSQNCKIDERPLQISIQCPNMTANEIIAKIDRLKFKNNSIIIVESSHSIDLLAEGVSKINLFNEIKNLTSSNNVEILCIGDKGKWPGNDFELLKTKYSLSVDEISEDAYSCWNILPTNIKGEKAVQAYLGNIKIQRNYFMLDLNRMMEK